MLHLQLLQKVGILRKIRCPELRKPRHQSHARFFRQLSQNPNHANPCVLKRNRSGLAAKTFLHTPVPLADILCESCFHLESVENPIRDRLYFPGHVKHVRLVLERFFWNVSFLLKIQLQPVFRIQVPEDHPLPQSRGKAIRNCGEQGQPRFRVLFFSNVPIFHGMHAPEF